MGATFMKLQDDEIVFSIQIERTGGLKILLCTLSSSGVDAGESNLRIMTGRFECSIDLGYKVLSALRQRMQNKSREKKTVTTRVQSIALLVFRSIHNMQ
jgi:hypothetical protein